MTNSPMAMGETEPFLSISERNARITRFEIDVGWAFNIEGAGGSY